MRYLIFLSILIGATLTMAGCGQKGALYVPQDEPAKTAQQDTPKS
jgi:predicted small lipoprotein YifL